MYTSVVRFMAFVISLFYTNIQIAEGEEAVEGDMYVAEEESEEYERQQQSEDEGHESEEEKVPEIIVTKGCMG
jgi:sortase (surface protein transpeptidase)